MSTQRSLWFATLLSLLLASPVDAQINWTRDPANPVLHASTGNPNDILDLQYAFGPAVLWDQTRGVFFSWFESLPVTAPRISFSHGLSLDGSRWYYYSRSPILQTGLPGFDTHDMRGPCVIKDAGGYKMYYTGSEGSQYAIGLATSADGLQWQKHSGNPILSPGQSGDWDDAGLLYCKVLLVDSTYTMWYSGRDGSTSRIGLATSPDGVIWTKHPTNPVLDVGSPGQWDAYYVEDPAVLLQNGTYYMVYTARPQLSEQQIGLATSPDGINWQKYAGNPVLVGQPGWEGPNVTVGSMLFKDGIFHLWYSADGSGLWQAGYATSLLEYSPLGVGSGPVGVPEKTSLQQNYPNPFNPETVVGFGLAESGQVRLEVFNALGQRVKILVAGELAAGQHSARFDGAHLPSGTYFYRLTTSSQRHPGPVLQGKMLLLR